MTEYSERLKQRAQAAAERRKQSRREKVLTYATITVAVILALVVLFTLGALLTQFVWNVGIVGIVAACGGAVGKIGFWVALGFNLAWGSVIHAIRQVRGTDTTQPNVTNNFS